MCLGDSLAYHRGRKFSAKDKDNDENDQYDCAELHGMGGWWYNGDPPSNDCFRSNLNGVYKYPPFDGTGAADGIAWLTFHDDKSYSMKYADMKLRPT